MEKLRETIVRYNIREKYLNYMNKNIKKLKAKENFLDEIYFRVYKRFSLLTIGFFSLLLGTINNFDKIKFGYNILTVINILLLILLGMIMYFTATTFF